MYKDKGYKKTHAPKASVKNFHMEPEPKCDKAKDKMVIPKSSAADKASSMARVKETRVAERNTTKSKRTTTTTKIETLEEQWANWWRNHALGIQDLDDRHAAIRAKIDTLLKSSDLKVRDYKALAEEFSEDPDDVLKKLGITFPVAKLPAAAPGLPNGFAYVNSKISNTDEWHYLKLIESVQPKVVRRQTIKRLNDIGTSLELFGGPSSTSTQLLQKKMSVCTLTAVDCFDEKEKSIHIVGIGKTDPEAVDDCLDRLEESLLVRKIVDKETQTLKPPEPYWYS